MDAPPIRYAKTSDGVSIAFWTMGEGHPFVVMAMNCYSHIQMEAQWPRWRAWYDRVARGRKVVRFDPRGSGLSEAPLTELTLDGLVLDLEAVVDHLSLKTFDLMGTWSSGPIAITYAVRHPERVRRIVLWTAWTRLEADAGEGRQTLYELIDRDWSLYVDITARSMFGWQEAEVASQFAHFMRESVSAAGAKAWLEACRRIDVDHLLPEVQAPVLVLQGHTGKRETAQRIASRLTDARIAFLDLNSLPPLWPDDDEISSLIEAFLDEGAVMATGASPGGLSQREVEVLRLVAAGKSNPQIAGELVISLNTVQRHVSNILGKTGLANRTEAAIYARDRGLL